MTRRTLLRLVAALCLALTPVTAAPTQPSGGPMINLPCIWEID
jgi:hypothetical protein